LRCLALRSLLALHRAISGSALAAALCLLPNTAAAHSPVPGLAGFYTGMLHPLSTPGQLLGLLALGLMLGAKWPRWFAAPGLAFAIFCLVGMGLGQLGFVPTWADGGLLIVASLAAAFAALYPPGILTVFVLLTSAAGLLLGVQSTPDPGLLKATLISLAGSLVGANLALLYISGGVGWLRERFTQPWVQTGMRVLAAWLTAISVLSALLAFATQQP
jgi:hydrogenase/urease accessory protein HupE